MGRKLSVECGSGTQTYTVMLLGTEIDLEAVAQQVDQSLTEEARVDAILEAARGDILFIERRTPDGKLNDGPKGEPAFMSFSRGRDGRLDCVQRYKDDKENDGADGEPAFMGFDEEGRLQYAVHYKDGKQNDGPDGSPAQQDFNAAGRVLGQVHSRDGKTNDGPHGEPAAQRFDDDGRLVYASRCQKGIFANEPLTERQRANYQAKLKKASAAKRALPKP